MSNRFITGEKCAMAWQQVLGNPALSTVGAFGATTILSIKQMSLDEEGVIADVSHTRTASRTARIAGKGDHKGTINATFDLDQKPYFATPNIRFGSLGVVACGFDPNFAIQIPAIVTKTHYESAFESEVRYSFDFAESVFSGAIVYPAS